MLVYNITSVICLFIGGAAFASFFNCVAYRAPRHIDWVAKPSFCENCGERIKGVALFPVVGCLLYRAHCKNCHAYFGYFHAVTEMLTGLCCVLVCWLAKGFPIRFEYSIIPITIYGVIAVGNGYRKYSAELKDKHST